MKYIKTAINTATPKKPTSSLLLIYTGGTMGMGYDESGTLVPFDFDSILDKVPSLRTFQIQINVIAFDPPLDSSSIGPDHWALLATIIKAHYSSHDGFVILHGTDTMAYTASALSFMLENLNKPVIFTGAQLPISARRSDARENLITAIELASAKAGRNPQVPEVCIYFNYLLFRGNRVKKVESNHFDAFRSENYPALAQSGVRIEYNVNFIRKVHQGRLKANVKIDTNVSLVKLYPGINRLIVEAMLRTKKLKGVVLETFGSGNVPTEKWLISSLQKAIKRGVIVLNVSQCHGGKVEQGKYAASKVLKEIGVLSGSDITTEAALTKMMVIFGKGGSLNNQKKQLLKPICGEMT
jgi:L-asparaginase